MDRYKSTKMASIIGIAGNIFLLIIKAIAGFLTNSQAMIGDALNSAGDIISSLMTFVGNRIASKEADDDHNLGHGKAEYIYSLLISVVMLYIAFKLFSSSTSSLFNDYNYTYSNILIIVSIITIIVKYSLYLYTNRLYKKYNNILLRANSLDHRNDCLLTMMTLIAAASSKLGYIYVDGVVGILVSIWLLLSAISIFKNSYDILMDKSANEDIRSKVYDILERYPEIKKVNHFNSTPVGYQYQVSITIYVDGAMSTFKSHDIANRLEKDISSLEEVYLSIIHVNPIDLNNKKNKKRKK